MIHKINRILGGGDWGGFDRRWDFDGRSRWGLEMVSRGAGLSRAGGEHEKDRGCSHAERGQSGARAGGEPEKDRGDSHAERGQSGARGERKL